VLCIGLTKGENDDGPLFDLESAPWNKKKNSKMKPKQNDFVNEMCRLESEP
jgi:hypothetical protein